jgi:hypothetical protein
MSTAAFDELRLFTIPPTDDPELRARRTAVARWALEVSPETREELLVQEARLLLRRVLKARNLSLGAGDEARIDACADRGTLERWLEQAAVATSGAEALR